MIVYVLQIRSLHDHLYPEQLRVLAQQVEEQQAQIQNQNQVKARLQRQQPQEAAEREGRVARSPQVTAK